MAEPGAATIGPGASSTTAPEPEPVARLSVVLVAPYLRPGSIGEVNWTFRVVEALARRVSLTILVNDAACGADLAQALPGVRVEVWQEPPLLRARFERLNSMAKPGIPFFFRWARGWIRAARRRGERIDVAHQILPRALRYASPMRGTGVPAVIGPLSGSLAAPPALAGELRGAPLYTRLRAVDQWRFRNDPWLRAGYAEADFVLGIAPYVQEILADAGLPLRRFEVFVAGGAEAARPPAPARQGAAAEGYLHLLHVGRAVRTKGLRDVIRALAHLRERPGLRRPPAGEGEDLTACGAEAARLGVADRVTFLGRLSREAVDDLYRQADVLCFPSFREPMGGVLFEAMGHGLPIVAARWGGPGYIVDDSCGIRVPVDAPEAFARGIADAVARLQDDPALRERLGQGARARLASFGTWDDKADRLVALYHEAIGAHCARADG